MSEIDNQDLNSKTVPFFARYLEGQFPEELSEEEMAALSGGVLAPGSVTTLRYPSDHEGDSGVATTLRYPSDQEGIGGGFGGFSIRIGGGFGTVPFPTVQEIINARGVWY